MIGKTLIALLAAGALLVPPSASASSAWSTVTVQQKQDAVSPHHGFDIKQVADIHSSTHIGNIEAISESYGNQTVWARGKAKQQQTLTAGTAIEWDADTWPAEGVAKTTGGVEQHQWTWSAEPSKVAQQARIWQGIRDFDQCGNCGCDDDCNDSQWLTVADADIRQGEIGIVGDITNKQEVAGKTKANVSVRPRHDFCDGSDHCSSHDGFGGTIVQRVNVLIENLLRF